MLTVNTITTTIPRPLWLRALLAVAQLLAPDEKRQAERRFMEIVRRQEKLVASICLSFAHSKEEFEDLRQDSMLNIWRGIDGFRADCCISTWVYRITLNTCVSSQRKKVPKAEAIAEFYRDLFDESAAEDVERYEQMYRLIGQLPPLDKAALLMWLDDKSYDEIAEVMGLSRNAVASRLKRAKEKLTLWNSKK